MSRFRLVSAEWVEQRLASPEFLVLDPRSVVRYMAGHPKNAVNFPVARQRDANGRLLSPEELARRLGSVGLDAKHTPVLYDNADGRNAAFLAWILVYLGCDDVCIMETFWEQWLADRREIFYRPVQPTPRNFFARLRAEVRATITDVQKHVQKSATAKLLDLRTTEEFSGKPEFGPRPGRIPGAAHLGCEQIGANGKILRPPCELEAILASRGLKGSTPAIMYCQTGVRAALGFLALDQLGRSASLYDGSYSEWSAAGLPVENDFQQSEGKNEKGENAHA